MQPDFMSLVRCPANHRCPFFSDDRTRKKGAAQKDIPSIEAGRVTSQHLQKEGRFEQTPDVTSHVVRTYRKEKRPFDAMFGQGIAQRWNTQLGAPVGIYINSKAEFHAAVCLAVIFVAKQVGINGLLQEEVEGLINRIFKGNARFPIQ